MLQNVYLGEEVEEPVFQYVPEKRVSPGPGGEASPLHQSLLLLEESLESGAITGQFEQLPRRNTNLAISECHLAENAAKNRYKDISPYDATRVKLADCPTGDYVNANHVVMEVPGSGIVNRYIATQGPLSSTCIDFWYMVMEQESPLIIMLTTVVERGRVKCHKYWPDLDTTLLYGSISVTCTREENKESFSYRDFTLVEVESGTERLVTQVVRVKLSTKLQRTPTFKHGLSPFNWNAGLRRHKSSSLVALGMDGFMSKYPNFRLRNHV